jgi:hypothetical protein
MRLHRIKEEWNILHTRGRSKANWRGNCFTKYDIERKVEWRIKM